MRWVGPTFLVLVTLLAAACTPAPPVPYAQQIQAQRSAKDAAFASDSPESPVPPADRARFLPLAYFPIDEGYHVPARLAPSDGEAGLDMPTSTGQRRKMRRAGQLRFSVKGQSLTLTAFVEADDRVMQRLFVPFGDPTNGTETYIGGRYLDLDRTVTGLYDLDFNRAYHPYCVYNTQYDCPYPPRENRLSMPIRSGERLKR
ncbi:MAG TPA: DUF1684 domain-containing protein [Vicinamibacterales bacterium]|nr:DUF1684 domain-containing protein [Vicinamibacterales bacterium]